MFEQQLRDTGCGLVLGGSGQGLSASGVEVLSSPLCIFSPIGKKNHKRKCRAESINDLVMSKQGEQKVKNQRKSNLPQISNLAYNQQSREVAYLFLSVTVFLRSL